MIYCQSKLSEKSLRKNPIIKIPGKAKKIPLIAQRYFRKRSRADSNRCRSFCRALPSHSATRPFICVSRMQNYGINLKIKNNVFLKYHFFNSFLSNYLIFKHIEINIFQQFFQTVLKAKAIAISGYRFQVFNQKFQRLFAFRFFLQFFNSFFTSSAFHLFFQS